MATNHLPEKKNISSVTVKGSENKGQPVKYPSGPQRVNPAQGQRVAVKRPSSHTSRPNVTPTGSPKQSASNGRVYPLNNTAKGKAQSAPKVSPISKQPPKGENQKQPAQVPKQEKTRKEPRGPLITAEGVGNVLFVILVSLVIYALLCGIVYGVFYAINHLQFDWNYDIAVKLDDSSSKPVKYTATKNTVFCGKNDEPYIAVSRLAGTLGLSAVGDADSIRYYKTGNDGGYAVFTDSSKEVNVNGIVIYLSSPVHIINGIAYVPISFFNYYTSGVTISYDENERAMTVLYTVDEALSTPKRKILKEFVFCVNSPEELEELTEKEWFEDVGNRS